MKFSNNNLAQFKISLTVICLVSCLTLGNCKDDHVTLKISEKSKLVGTQDITVGTNPRTYYSFRGIPYAEAPIGEKRWMEPKLLELTKPEYDTTEFGSPCVQVFGQMIGSEDCLFLNVYTPTLDNKENTKDLLPVMVYIHGGGYVLGSSNGAGPKFLLNHDVVLVTFNYRLGVFGYLSTGNKNLPGNYGALDQITVLDWVQKHIHKFGGDGKSVTIFGHSAGGAATHLLTMSPRSKGKYHKAIIQSATALVHWATIKNPGDYAKDYAGSLGCSQKLSNPELVNCLKKKSTTELIEAQSKRANLLCLPMHLSHVVDKDSRSPDSAFLLDYPEEIMDKGLYHPTPIMTGITANEGTMWYSLLHLSLGKKFNEADEFRTEIIPSMLKNVFRFGESKHISRVAEAVIKQYFPNDDDVHDDENKIQRVAEMFGDSLFDSAQWDTLQKFSKHDISPVYSYIFTHRTPKSPDTIWNQIKELRNRGIEHELFDSSVGHVDDMYYLFYPCELIPSNPNHKMSQEDLEFAHRMTGIFVTFAKNGNPADGIDETGGFHSWKPISSGAVNYYNLTSIPAPMGSEFRKEESLFWKQVFQSLEEKRNVDEL